MKTLILLIAVILSGCANLSDRQKMAMKFGAAVLVAGAIAANNRSEKAATATPPSPLDPCGISRQHCL